MAKEMLINVSEGEECRIALVDDGKLEELYMERTSSTSHVGNIYKGRVTNVEPSIQAAFVDFGLGRNGFLHISDLMPQYFGKKGEDIHEAVGRKMARRDRPPIQKCLRRGDDIVVQIIKEGIGTKGPTLSTYVSIPGRILVMMPGMNKMGISKKIEDEEERRRLRTILDSLKPPKGVGFIIRTAGVGKTKTEIQRDLTYLSRLWVQIEKIRDSKPAPVELYTEGDLVTRTVRDVFTTDISKIIADNKDVSKRVKEVIKLTSPRTRNRVELYEDTMPLFHKYGIEGEIEQMYSRHVPLPSGGSLVIDSTEAIVAIDVNSGKFREHADAETTAFKTDMEAADEIPRQLRLRDLGGVIICDFIDLRFERHRREVENRLHENLKNDRAKTKLLRMSQFGIIEMTRQRMRPSLKRSIYFDCPHCKGAGLIKTPESMSLDVMRRLAIAANDLKVARIELAVCPDVAFYLLNRKRTSLADLETETHKKILVRSDPTLGLDEQLLMLFDSRDGLVILPQLASVESVPHTTQLNTRPAEGGGRGRRRRRGRGRGRDATAPAEEERYEAAEEAVEVRSEGPVRAGESLPKDQEADALAESDVVDIEEGSEIGERPAGEFDRQDRGGHDRRGHRRRGGRRSRRDQFHPVVESTERKADEIPAEEVESSADMDETELETANAEAEFAGQDDESDESAPGNIAGSSEGGDVTGKRRRRRRGGRRHRRRRERQEQGSDGQTPAQADSQSEPVEVSIDDDAPEPGNELYPPQRPSQQSRNNNRRRGKGKHQRVGNQYNQNQRRHPQRIPPQQQSRPSPSRQSSPPPRIERTGSTDKHLINDEPATPQTPSTRPRTYRDLDEIPEDYD